MGSVLNVQIIYDQISEAPQPVQENMEYDLETGKTRTIKYRFNVKLFDRGGYLVCKQPCFFKDFVLDKTGQHPKIMMSYQTQGCGINSYEKIASAVVDYNN
jgi:hypothetical protein